MKLLLGAHMSIAGGVELAFERGEEAGCTAMQIFTANASRWRGKPISSKSAEKFRKRWQESPIGPVFSHDSYLINLASQDERLWQKSKQALLEEMQRCSMLGIPAVVMHPGAHLGAGENTGLERIRAAFDTLLACAPRDVMILVENTAGQGTHLGHRFEHLAEVMNGVESPVRLGICLDTAHTFAAGYAIGEAQDYRKTMQAFDAVIGLDHLKLIHVNDSKTPFASKVDRHEHIGKGFIGDETFSFFLKDASLKARPFILETPKGEKGEATMRDKENLNTLRRLRES